MTSPSSRRRTWLHFAALGGALFALQQLSSYAYRDGTTMRLLEPEPRPEPESSPTPVRIPDETLLYREALRRGLDRGDSVVRRRLVQNMRFLQTHEAVARERDDEALYREALALGLDSSDPVVRRRLVESMRHTLIAESEASSPDDVALRAHLLANEQRFAQPERRRFEQLYYASAHRARHALASLRNRGGGEGDDGSGVAAVLEVDALPIPRNLPPLSQRELGARLGDSFASDAFALPVGRWSGPIASSYGTHVVRVAEWLPARTPSVAEVRPALTAHWTANREESIVRSALVALRREHASGRLEARP